MASLHDLGYTARQIGLMSSDTKRMVLRDQIPNRGVSIMKDGRLVFVPSQPVKKTPPPPPPPRKA